MAKRVPNTAGSDQGKGKSCSPLVKMIANANRQTAARSSSRENILAIGCEAGHQARRKLEAKGADLQWSVEWMGVEAFVGDVVASLENVGGGFGAEDILVPPEVICMGVRDEAIFFGTPRIQPELKVWQIESVFCFQWDWFGHFSL